jgi:hypothetical protein
VEEPKELLQTVTRVSNALRDAGVRFALTGGCAIYARGGPAPWHDVDILVRPDDVGSAIDALRSWGLSPAETPEDWLAKAYDGDRLVDVIHRPNECRVTDEMLDQATEVRVGPVSAPVVPATHLVTDKLLVLGPHRCDMTGLLAIVRALREQIDWRSVRRQTEHSPYAEAFLLLVDRLGIAGPQARTVREGVG